MRSVLSKVRRLVRASSPRAAGDASREPLGSARPLRLVVVASAPAVEAAAALALASPAVQVVSPGGEPADADSWIYAPVSSTPLTVNHVRNALLCLAHDGLDFLVVSHGLVEPPRVAIGEPRDALVFRADVWAAWRDTGRLPPGARGRIARLLPAPPGARLAERDLDALGLGPLTADGAELSVPGAPPAPAPARRPAAPLFPVADRETVLVVPIMMAVGGVERNLIEVLKALRDRYAFVIVTTERLAAARGSLNHQAIDACESLFELGELLPQSEFLAALGTIQESVQAQLVWICNGSPWLLAHTRALRALFRDVPIVDQQVYDTRAGWIEHYDDPGIRSFDRFIAINRDIRTAFESRLGIPGERIDLIHHAIDAERFSIAVADGCDREARARELGVPSGGRRFGQIARLTAQKRPLDFLELARRAAAAGLDDRFLLVGDGELAPACDQFVARHGLENVVRIRYCDDMSRLLPVLDGLVITSEYEGLPISMLEALAMGVPVLSTDVGEVAAVLDEGGAGRTLPVEADADGRWQAFLAWREGLAVHRERARAAAPALAERFSAQTVGAAYERSWRTAQARRAGRGSGAVRLPAAGALPPMSVVIPTFNRAALLVDTLERCHACAGPVELEYIVIDDGSRDDTVARLERLATRIPNLTWRTGPNRGPGHARNFGASIAKHDLVLFLGDDIQPEDDRFFLTHAEIHARQPEASLAVLGKVVWPNRPGSEVSYVMSHVQGRGGEQFGYAHLLPHTFVDWRFFYTANVSVKRRLVEDWMSDGFSGDFTLAAYEDVELAYRMTMRPDPLRIFYAPGSLGTHHHPYSVESFLRRQTGAGMMARVFLDRHPNPHVRDMIGLGGVVHALEQAPVPHSDRMAADYLAMIEGLKAWARIVESQQKLGSRWWHEELLRAVFNLAYLQGFVAASASPAANVAGAYYFLLDSFAQALERTLQVELTGRALGNEDVEDLFSTRGGPPVARSFPRLRAWAKRQPLLRQAVLRLRAWRYGG